MCTCPPTHVLGSYHRVPTLVDIERFYFSGKLNKDVVFWTYRKEITKFSITGITSSITEGKHTYVKDFYKF